MARALIRIVRRFGLALLLIFCCGPLQCATLERLSLEDMTAKSTAIVRGQVLSSYAAAQGSIIYTHYKVQIGETWKGSLQGTVDLMVPGGATNGVRQTFAGAPQLTTGAEYVLFLWAGKAGTQIMGLTQGLFSIVSAASGKDYAVRAATSELMVEPATGQIVQDQPVSMRLSDLKARVASIQGKGSAQ